MDNQHLNFLSGFTFGLDGNFKEPSAILLNFVHPFDLRFLLRSDLETSLMSFLFQAPPSNLNVATRTINNSRKHSLNHFPFLKQNPLSQNQVREVKE